MANEDILTDDYVASLLTRDARESSIKYSAMGLEGLVNSKPPANKPKPNTRFLRNIIKDTDSHNAALLAKEAAESRARLNGLAGNEYREQKASRIGGGDIRKRQLGDIAAILGGRPAKRKRTESTKPGETDSRRRRNTSSEEDEPKKTAREERRREHRSRDHDEADEEASSKHRSSRRKHRSASPDREDSRHDRIKRRRSTSRDRTRDDRKKRRRSTSRERGRETTKDERSRQHKSSSMERIRPKDDPKKQQKKQRRSRSRSRSPKEHRKEPRHRDRSPQQQRSRSPIEASKKSRRSHRSPSVDPKSKRKENETESQKGESKEDYDSDPLDDIIGPRPPPVPEVRSRGRGTVSRASGIDSRFSADYDPTADVQLDPDEENDWDQALEALKDRQKWKQKGADRLRAAGFTDDDIKKWENGGEKREEDVKWAKKGEGREWDRGKVLDEDGVVSFDPAFGRLKDT